MSTPSSTTTSCSSSITGSPPPPYISSCFASKLFGSFRYHHHLFDQIHNQIGPPFFRGLRWGLGWEEVEDSGGDLSPSMSSEGGNFPHSISLDVVRILVGFTVDFSAGFFGCLFHVNLSYG